jgi:hypothetical protein
MGRDRMMKYLGVKAFMQAAFLGALLAMPLAAQAAGSDYDKLDKGPKIGAAIPQPLKAADQNGTGQDFASLRGDRGLIVLFSRSLDW